MTWLWTLAVHAGTGEMADVVVTGTPIPAPYGEVPASVLTVPRERLTHGLAYNVDDLLRGLPGVSVVRSYGIGYGIPSQVDIRGVPGLQRVLVYADGMPLNEVVTGFPGLNDIPAEAIERVEVGQGPFSSMYGADAFAGVLQVFTREPGHDPGLRLLGGAGNGGYLKGGVETSGNEGDTAWYAIGDTRAMENYTLNDTIEQPVYNLLTGGYDPLRRAVENCDYRDQRMLAKLRFPVARSVAGTLHVRGLRSELGYGMASAAPFGDLEVENVIETETLLAGLSLDAGRDGEMRARLNSYVRTQDRETLGLGVSGLQAGVPLYAPAISAMDAMDWRGEGMLALAPAGHHTFALGGDLHVSSADFSAAADGETGESLPGSVAADEAVHTVGLSLHDDLALADSLRASAGLRWDANSDFEDAWSPRAGLAWAPGGPWTARASVGRAFLAPSLLSLYQPPISFGTVTFRSNPDLQPAYITSGDAALEWRNRGVRAHLAGFCNEMEDLIARSNVDAMSVTYENIEDARSAGIQCGAELRAARGLFAQVGATLQTTENLATGDDLAYMPETMGAVSLGWERPMGRGYTARMMATEHYMGRRGYSNLQTGEFTWMDVSWLTDASARVVGPGGSWLGVSVRNLWDAEYRESSTLYPAPGRFVAMETGIKLW